MYFKRLEIFGFKSFADKTILNFEPGITAVVGPNGCGKSNIFDAIRWVLGEQSVKELRGGSMEDVIFNGTLQKSPLGFAEVSLTFSNESRMLPMEYDEITITRRLFRSGESEYLLNKTPVRLKDILEILMGTGIGAEAYSLIQQGKVDLVVSSRPEDRRIIIDEAAGITKYKAKKKEALNKLKDSEGNLLRINDITIEVKRQISSIERQANKAKRYKEKYEKLKELEVKMARNQLGLFSREKSELCSFIKDFEIQEKELCENLVRLNQEVAEENRAIEELEQKISDTHAEDMKLENQTAMDNRQISFNEERIENLRTSDIRLSEQYNQMDERCQQQKQKIKNLKEMLAGLNESFEEKRRILGQKKDSLEEVAQEIKRAKATIKEDEERVLGLTSQQVNVKNELTEIMKEFQGTLARKRRLEVENEKVSCEKDEVDNRLRSVSEDIESCSSKIGNLKEQRDTKRQALSELKSRQSIVIESIDNLEKKKISLISQRDFIEKLQVQYEDMPDPTNVGRLLTTNAPQESNKGIIGKIKDVFEVDPLRLEALKQNFSQLTDGTLYEVICETKFIELDPKLITVKIDELSSQIEAKMYEKERLAQTIEEQEKVIQSMNSAIHDQEKVFSIYEAQKNDILEESGKLLEELEVVSEEIREAREILAGLKAKDEGLNVQLDEVERELQMLQMDIKEKQDWITVKRQQREEATVCIAQLETEIQSIQEKEASEKENMRMFEEVLIQSLDEIRKIECDSAENERKAKTLQEEVESIKIKITDIVRQRSSLQEVLAVFENQKVEHNNKLDSVHQNIASVEEKIEVSKNKVHGHQMKDQEISFNEKSIKDRLLQSYKIDLDQMLADEQNQQLAQPGAGLGVDAQQPFIGPLTQEQSMSLGSVEEPFNVDEITLEIEQLRKRCDSFGTVNLVAIDEYEELKQRFEFLTKQQSDLLAAKESLHRTIQKINRTTRQMFLDTFTRVSEEFRIYFRMLFGGGEAQLVLVDPENVLESGIEIIAKPPGKKLQNISLLSGGEKTLAAIALIFGVFKVRPSPFCVLDEIDAALDESNVGRFAYLLKDFAKIAQFIIITHNKKTIANASVMYGITMQESGVSKIVSVKLLEENKEEEVTIKEPVGV